MKTRIISALVAIGLGAIVVLLHHTIVFNITISALTFLMLYELFSALKCNEFKVTTIPCYIYALEVPILLFFDLDKYRYPLLIFFIISAFSSFLYQHKKLSFEKLSAMLVSSLLITFAMSSLIELKDSNKEHGLFLLLLSLCGAWLADTGAYFVGTLMGKHKLCPNISPKKTVEGLIGGTITNGILFIGIGLLYSFIKSKNGVDIEINYIFIAILGMLCSLLGLLGDLSASLVKRQCNIKDYGNIMPGHGGALDRFDSVLFVVPFMSLATQYITLIQ